jgi:hypothetical protein
MSQTPIDLAVTLPKTASGEKVLVKALTAIVNREGNRKRPVQKMNFASFEYP